MKKECLWRVFVVMSQMGMVCTVQAAPANQQTQTDDLKGLLVSFVIAMVICFIIWSCQKRRTIKRHDKTLQKLAEKWNQAGEAYCRGEYETVTKLCSEMSQSQPSISEIFNNWGTTLNLWARVGGPHAESRFQQACEKYQKATELKPDSPDAFYNWGTALYAWAKLGGADVEFLYQQACEKCQKAAEIKSDQWDVFKVWGSVLLCLVRMQVGEKKEELLKQAEEKCLRAEAIEPGSGAYNLGCVYGIRGDEANCRKWLEAAQKKGTLPTWQYAMEDPDLASMRDKDWFRKFKWEDDK